jgi:colanic acid/amylovoran biosynthesis glycosyltransferase
MAQNHSWAGATGAQGSPCIKPAEIQNDSQNPLGGRADGRFAGVFMPVVASYCTTFLKREMLHIYRQVTGLREFRTFVMTKSRENADLYPFGDVEVLPRPRIHFLARFQKKYIQRLEPVFYRGEYDQLSGVLGRREADLLHVYFGHTGVHLLPFLKNWPKPSLVSFHGMDIMERDNDPGYGVRLRNLLQTVPMVLARSESLAERLAAFGCSRSKIRINRTGIPMDGFPFAPRTAPADDAWRLIQASRFIEKKGLFVTLGAFAEFRKIYPKSRLVLAGEGPLENRLRETAAELGIADAVSYTGFLQQQQLAEAYAESHIFLHPSQTTEGGDQEGVPNSMLEAMATGLPVVATIHGGIPEAVASGEDGLLVPERDLAGVANALLTLAGNPSLYERLSHEAAVSVREKFEQSRSIAKLEGFYRELLEIHGTEKVA